jgi:hypothetical protein
VREYIRGAGRFSLRPFSPPSFEKRFSGENMQKRGGENENFLKKLRWRALKKGRREAIIDASVP